jgi:Ser/Thr protein kinase RdoA (MazF antagonist)
MGEVLGRFHRSFAQEEVPVRSPYRSPHMAIAECEALEQKFAEAEGDFAAIALKVLREQIALLRELPDDIGWRLPAPSLGGVTFGSFWVEQVLFHPDGQVAALVDWTDGAGETGHWASDIVCGLHLSALDEEGILAFCSGYQAEHPLPAAEWRAVAAMLCYGHLANTNFLGGWLEKSYRRMADWERISEPWHRMVPERYRRWKDIEAGIVRIAEKT